MPAIPVQHPITQPLNGNPPHPVSSGNKAKAHDILAAIRTLKTIEAEHRPATTDEQGILSRFGGFGPVAKEIFPNPVTGDYKPGWHAVGEELRSLLTPEEYDSAKRTTFSQFFTSPSVMKAMHGALAQLGVPADGTVLEPGCGTGQFMTNGHRYIGVKQDALSGRIARALHPK